MRNYITLFGFLLLVTSFASAAPIAHWNFDECQGPTAADSVGGSHLALTNGAQWTTDARSGCAIHLDGADDYLRDGGGPFGMTEISLGAWIKRDSSQDGTIISRNGPYYLAIRNNVVAAGIFHGGGSEGWDHIIGTTPLQIGQWYYIAMSYDRTDLKVFVNNREDNSIRRSGSIYWDGHVLTLGWGEPGVNQYFHGVLDEAVIYDAAVTQPPMPSLNITNIGGTSISPLFRTPTNPFGLQFTFRPNQNYPLPNIPPETIVGNLTLAAPFFASQPYYLRYYIELREFNTPLYYAFENFGFMPRMLYGTLHFDEITSFYIEAMNGQAVIPVARAFLDIPYYVQALAYNGNEFVLSDGYRVIIPSSQPPVPGNCTLIEDFSSGTLDPTKWRERPSNTPSGMFTDEHFVHAQEGVYHTAQLQPTDRGTKLDLIRYTFAPGQSVEFDVNYQSGSGNQMHVLDANDNNVREIALFGVWNSENFCAGNAPGRYHVKAIFTQQGVDVEVTKPNNTTVICLQFGEIRPASAYNFSVVTRTGHNGIAHMDYDNFCVR